MADNDEDLYDEFGNYIGPDLDSSSEEDSSSDDESDASSRGGAQGDDDVASDVSDDNKQLVEHDGMGEEEATAAPSNAIVLHEDKVHYPSASEVYGEGVRTAVLDEDAMDIDVPIIEPPKTKTFSFVHEKAEEVGTTTTSTTKDKNDEGGEDLVSDSYLATTLLMNETTVTRRCVALAGHLHHGKTTFVDLLLEQTKTNIDAFGPRAALESHNSNAGGSAAGGGGGGGGGPRYTDTLKAEHYRQMSIKSTPITLPLPDLRGKCHALTMIDCPGHTHFHDETVASFKAADGAVIAIDALEGIMMHTEMCIRQAISDGLPIVLVITKVDRLILECKLPPNDLYYKLRHLIDSVNALIQNNTIVVTQKHGAIRRAGYPKLSPDRGNVAFSSGMHGWCFTLDGFANMYLDNAGGEDGLGKHLTPQEFAKRLWGDTYLNAETGLFERRPPTSSSKRTFVEYILEPLYKIYTACLGEKEDVVSKTLRSVGVLLSRDQLRSSARPLLRAACRRFFGVNCGYVDMIVRHIPSPAAAARGKVARCYTGPLDSPVATSMIKCDPRGPLMIHCVKLYAAPDGQSFSTFGRIYSGTIKPGDRVKVLGEAYSPDDDEDMALATVSTVSIPRGRRRTEVTMARAGNWVLLDGVDANISKTATITGAGSGSAFVDSEHNVQIFSPLKFPQVS
uniref:Tr-type G domain-containing protein n=1 Tax=Ditylum brightwellii TaxID=49249 RepID=A0A6V2JL03_9STRA